MSLRSALIPAALFCATISAHADSFTVGSTVSGTVPASQITSAPTISGSFYGNTFAGSLGGGNLVGSTGVIGGNTVTFDELFCVDFADNIYLGTTYAASYTTNGTIQNGTPVTNAGQIAWLIENLGPTATTADQNIALQTAIWEVEYGSNFVFTSASDSSIAGDISADLSALGNNTAAVNSLYWISPTNSDATNAQGLAGTLAPTPEPSSIALLATGLLGFAGLIKKRFA
jgi:hypothetical protein